MKEPSDSTVVVVDKSQLKSKSFICKIEFFKKPPSLTPRDFFDPLINVKNYPFIFLTISAIQVIVGYNTDYELLCRLQFEPMEVQEPWRLFTTILVDSGSDNVFLTVMLQIVATWVMEARQGRIIVFLVYLFGNICGMLGCAYVQPLPMSGALPGVYALMASQLLDFHLNYMDLKTRYFSLIVALSFVTYVSFYFCIAGFVHNDYDRLLDIGKVFGLVSGIMMGMSLFKSSDPKVMERIFWMRIFSALVYSALMIFLTYSFLF